MNILQMINDTYYWKGDTKEFINLFLNQLINTKKERNTINITNNIKNI